MLVEREKLEKEIDIVLKEVSTNKFIVEQLKNELLNNHKISPGYIQSIINKNILLNELNLNILCLLVIYLKNITRDENIDPKKYFTEKEINVARRYEENVENENNLKLPLTIDDVLMLDSENYLTTMTLQQVVNLFESGLLEYNFQTQRSPKLKRQKDTIIMVPNINKKSVQEIKEHILNNTYLPDTIVFNVLADGNEKIIYNSKNRQLIIESGEIDVLDGFHRVSGMMQAYKTSPDIEFNIHVAIKNYNLRKAQSYVAQVNTVNKIDKTHLKVLKSDRYSDFIVKELQRESDLKGKIVQVSRVSSLNQGLVTFSVLSDTIDEQFKITNKKEATNLANYLTNFFDNLLGSYSDIFLDDYNKIEKIRKESLINNNITFAGYVVLAKRFHEENIPVEKTTEILDSINFSKANPLWEQIGVLKEGRISSKAREKMVQYFKNLQLEDISERRYS